MTAKRRHESPWARAHEAALGLAEAGDDDRDYVRREDRARKSWIAYGVWAATGHDPRVKVIVVYRKPKTRPTGQLGLWPTRAA
jgi:hypothetical protein